MKSALVILLVMLAATPAFAEAPQTSQTAEPRRSWPGRHPVLIGTLIGAGVGVSIGVATCKYPTAEASSCSDFTFPGHARMLGGVTIGLYGAAIGAGIGALIGRVKR